MFRNEGTVFSERLTPREITQIIVSKGVLSHRKKKIVEAQKYFSAHGTNIHKKKRVYFDKDRNEIENPYAHNAQIYANFLRMLVEQKQDYGFAKSFVLQLSTDKEDEIDLKTDSYGSAWKEFCTRALYKMSRTLAGQAINCGIAWCYVWIDEKGELRIDDVDPALVYPEWNTRQHEELSHLVYHYTMARYNSTNPDIREYAEYWTKDERRLFDVTAGYNEVSSDTDENGIPVTTHLRAGENGLSWGKVPFVCLKGTDDETPLLAFIKPQIDAYNELASKCVDGLIDDLDPILILKGVSPSVSDLLEAREIAKMTRTVSLDTDGDAHYIQAVTPVGSHISEMTELRRDIIKFGYGVDYEDARFGNPNQLVVKSLYQSQDTYIDGLERQFQTFIENLKYFFDKWYEMSGKGSFEETQLYRVRVRLDRSAMINQTALLDDLVKGSQLSMSRRTLLEQNPLIQDVDLEEERIREEEEQSGGMFDFPEENDNEE